MLNSFIMLSSDILKNSFFLQLFIDNCLQLAELHQFVFSVHFLVFSSIISLVIFIMFSFIGKFFFEEEFQNFLKDFELLFQEEVFNNKVLNKIHFFMKFFFLIDFLLPHYLFIKNLWFYNLLGVFISMAGPIVLLFCPFIILNIFYYYLYLIALKAFLVTFFYKNDITKVLFMSFFMSKDPLLCNNIIATFMGNMDKSFKTFIIIGAGTLGLVSAFALGDLAEKQISLKRFEEFRNSAVQSALNDNHGVLTPEERMRVLENADKAYSEVVNKTILREGFQRLKPQNLSLKDKEEIARMVKEEIHKTSGKKS